jgi:hypothetical protein
MEYRVDYLPDKKIIGIKMKGRLNFQIAEKYSEEAVKLARENDCKKFLIDHTETIMQGGVNKIHAAGDELVEFGFKNTDRIAIVIANQENGKNLLNSVNKNSRWSVLKYFYADDMQEAFDWLLEIE